MRVSLVRVRRGLTKAQMWLEWHVAWRAHTCREPRGPVSAVRLSRASASSFLFMKGLRSGGSLAEEMAMLVTKLELTVMETCSNCQRNFTKLYNIHRSRRTTRTFSLLEGPSLI